MKASNTSKYLLGLLPIAVGCLLFFHPLAGQSLAAGMQATAPAGQEGGRGRGRGPQSPEQAARVGNSTPMDLEGSNLGRRHFDPGNRTYWHSHAGGFLMLVEKGHGRVQHRGEPMRELGPGDVDYTPPGVEHWHGAAPDDEMIQLAVVVGGGGIQFKEPVTDAEYQGKAK